MSKISLEEKALRHADKFFTDERLWWRVGRPNPGIRATCVGLLLNKYRRSAQGNRQGSDGGFQWASEVMGVPRVTAWNDSLHSFKAMKSALKARIEHYKGMRT